MRYLHVLSSRLTEPLTSYTEVLFFSSLKLFLPHQLSWWLSHNKIKEQAYSLFLYFGTPIGNRSAWLKRNDSHIEGSPFGVARTAFRCLRYHAGR